MADPRKSRYTASQMAAAEKAFRGSPEPREVLKDSLPICHLQNAADRARLVRQQMDALVSRLFGEPVSDETEVASPSEGFFNSVTDAGDQIAAQLSYIEQAIARIDKSI